MDYDNEDLRQSAHRQAGYLPAAILSLGLIPLVKFLSCSTKRVEGVVTGIEITSPGRAKQLHPDWIPVPFDGRNYRHVPSRAILTLRRDNGIEYVCSISNGFSEEEARTIMKPKLGDVVYVEVARFGVHTTLTGDERRFHDGVCSLNACPRYPAVERWGVL